MRSSSSKDISGKVQVATKSAARKSRDQKGMGSGRHNRFPRCNTATKRARIEASNQYCILQTTPMRRLP